MARIRTIKPEFFTSADIVCMTPLSRLFYASLWCEADREGRMKWDTRTLKLRYFPADNCDIDAMADELISSGLVIVYEVDGRLYAEIPSFKQHQVINNREAESSIPSRVKEASARVQGEGKGKEGKERKSREEIASVDLPDWIPIDQWSAYVEMRKFIKAPLSGRAVTLAINELAKLREKGNDPALVLDRSVMNNWKGLFEIPKDKTESVATNDIFAGAL